MTALRQLSPLVAWLAYLAELHGWLLEHRALASRPITNWEAMQRLNPRIGARVATVFADGGGSR